MFYFILKRIALIFVTLLTTLFFTFLISSNTPGDPVEQLLQKNKNAYSQIENEIAYKKLKNKLGLDLPLFYFSICSSSYPDSLFKIFNQKQQYFLERIAFEFGNSKQATAYYQSILDFKTEDNKFISELNILYNCFTEQQINNQLKKLRNILSKNDTQQFETISIAFQQLSQNKKVYKSYIPNIRWYGNNNQFHIWLFGDYLWFSDLNSNKSFRTKGIVRGDFGNSFSDGRPVFNLIVDALKWTVTLSLISILIIYLIAIPLGIWLANKKGSKAEHFISLFLYALYSMPTFWIATLFIIFLCNPDFWNIFPPAFNLIDFGENDSTFTNLVKIVYYLFLPVVCGIYGSIAYLSRQMESSISQTLLKQYIQTARAKGLSNTKILWKHAFKNALLPIITLFAGIFPLIISGSIILETIFSIPGMGKLSFDALLQRDYPVIYTTVLLTAFLTLVGTLIADILYAKIDPRITFNAKNI